MNKSSCLYTIIKRDGYGASWTTECGERIFCETPTQVGLSFPPLPTDSGKFCHYCGKEIKLNE